MAKLLHIITTFTTCLMNFCVAHGEIKTDKVPTSQTQCYFSHYTTENGLCSNNVHDVVEDKHGFIWLATHHGISRFDGCSFRNYEEAHFPEMKRNDTYHAFVLPNGNITFGGSNFTLYSYDDKEHTFHDISGFAGDKAFNFDITGCSLAQDGECLLSSGMGVFAYDSNRETFEPVCSKFENKKILKISKDFKNRYWLGGYNGVCITDREGNILYDYRKKIGELINNILHVDSLHILLCSNVGSLWLAKLEEDGDITSIEKVPTPFHSVSAIGKRGDNSILIGTSGDGLWLSTFEKGNFTFNKIIPINKVDATLSKVSTVYVDSKNRAWISTNDNGVWCMNSIAETKSFSSIELGIPKSVGSAFLPCGKDSMLLCTDGAGLILLDSNNNVLRHWTVNNGLPSNNVLDIEEYNVYIDDVQRVKQGFLVSFWGGNPVYLSAEDWKLHSLNTNTLPTPVNTVKNILRLKDGSYYLSTGGYGVYCLKDNTLSDVHLDPSLLNGSQDLWTEQSVQLSDGTIRILTSRTIWSNRTGTITPVYPDIALTNSKNPLLFLQCIEDDKGGYFVVANKGVFRFLADDSAYEKLDFLPSGEYFSILRTDDNRIWVSSSCGILAIDYEHRKYEVVFSADGLTGDYFVRKASCVAEDGKLLFGCKHGFVCVNPKFIHKDATEYLSFSELYVNEQRISFDSTRKIVLDYGQTHLSLTLDAVNFADPNTYDLRYRIMPVDTIWNKIPATREINIDFLPDGDFNIEVGVFSPNGDKFRSVSLHLTVLPPWWKSIQFALLCIALSIALGFFISNRRVTALKKRKEELQKAVDEKTLDLKNANIVLENQKKSIEEKNESLLNTIKLKDQLVSVVAHDLKNPMFAIVTTLRRINNFRRPVSESPSEQGKGDETGRLISEATLEAERIQTEMVKLLQWASNSDERMKCQINNIDLRNLVVDVLSFLQPLCDNKEITLDYSVSKISHNVLADEKMLAVVVRNIVSNAIKFTDRGKSIKVSATEQNDKIVLAVKDEGVGMSPDFINRIKNRENITSSHGTENEKGYGMGLKIVLDFAAKMGATIDFASEAGQGTTVTVTLNAGLEIETYAEESASEACAEPHNVCIDSVSQQLSVDKSFLEDKTILVVDDDKLLLDNIKAMLSDFVSVQTANNGMEGMDLAEKIVPDLIVSDVDMPNMNGIDMCRQLARNSTTSNIPVLFLSAKKDLSVKIAGLSAGAVDYIVKPFNEGELLLKIFNFLRMQQRRQIKILAGTLDCKIDGQHEGNTVEQNEINPLIQQLLDCIQDNYSNPDYSFNDIARDMGFSKSTLTRRLKSIIDKSPIEILSEYRMHKAKNLLAEGKMSVSEVAYSVGFNDPSYFSRKYKDFFGTQPSK